MEGLFITFLNMSITASWLILAVMAFRFAFNKAPKWMNYILWAIVAIRLICPITIESELSLIPSTQTVSKDIIYEQQPTIESGAKEFFWMASVVWIVGILVLILYAFISYFKLSKKVQEAVCLKENIWQCDNIGTAFILGIIRPRIYIPSSLTGKQIEHVIAHEKSHIKCLDQLWKPIGFAILTIYWFNPFIWTAYILLCKDIEIACDERVVRCLSAEEKKAYSNSLLECSLPRYMISACPVAFGEVGIKTRVKSVLYYKKPTIWVSALAIVVCIGSIVGFLTNPIEIEAYPTSNVNFEESWRPEQGGIDKFLDIPEKIQLEDVLSNSIVVRHYDRNGNYVEKEQFSTYQILQPTNVEDYVLRTILFYKVNWTNRTDGEGGHTTYPESIKVYYAYEWLKPQMGGKTDSVTVSWSDDNFILAEGSFGKIDKYTINGEEYVEDSGLEYTSVTDTSITWDISLKKDTSEVETLYGSGHFELVPKEYLNKAGIVTFDSSYSQDVLIGEKKEYAMSKDFSWYLAGMSSADYEHVLEGTYRVSFDFGKDNSKETKTIQFFFNWSYSLYNDDGEIIENGYYEVEDGHYELISEDGKNTYSIEFDNVTFVSNE